MCHVKVVQVKMFQHYDKELFFQNLFSVYFLLFLLVGKDLHKNIDKDDDDDDDDGADGGDNHNVDKHDDDGDHHVDNDDSDNNDDDNHGQLRREFKVWSEAACVFHLHN